MSDASTRSSNKNAPAERPTYRPSERFWPYVNVPEDPTPEELAALDSELAESLFGDEPQEFSITLSFPQCDSEDYPRAVELAQRAPDYVTVGTPDQFRHRARFYAEHAVGLHELFEIVGPYENCEVLVNDQAVPFARELWLPLMWLLFRC